MFLVGRPVGVIGPGVGVTETAGTVNLHASTNANMNRKARDFLKGFMLLPQGTYQKQSE
jgi:hypothetical protein